MMVGLHSKGTGQKNIHNWWVRVNLFDAELLIGKTAGLKFVVLI